MILFIHGVSQQEYIHREHKLESIWRDHLKTGLMQFPDCDVESILASTRLAFYADLTDPSKVIEPVQSAASAHLEAELHAEIEGQPVQAWYHSEALSGTLRAIDNTRFLRSTIGTALLHAVSEEATIYLGNTDIRNRVHERVLSSINGETDVDVVIGHSLGSVVAFDLIASGALTANGLITLGSPLGSEAFRRRLPTCPVSLDGRIDAWRDIRDPLDLVSFQELDILKLSEKHVEGRPTFTSDKVDNPTDNKHGIGGYLPLRIATARVLEVIRERSNA